MNRDLAARLAIICLPHVGPARARWLLGAAEAPAVLDRLRAGRLPEDLGPQPAGVGKQLLTDWIDAARRIDPAELLDKHRSLGIGLLVPEDERWPFDEDPDPPLLLFYTGDLSLLDHRPAVAVVGTRRCTTVGRTVAYGFGKDLAAAGAVVVSGLALGIDGAAHRGALDHLPRSGSAPVVGVVGSGLDVVYPGGNRRLWDEVGLRGLLLGEAPAGTRPERWRFPARNRMIAGLSEGVVVVESHHQGGSLLTVDEAVDRGKPVFAVPGSVLSPASDGCNGLLVDGAVPVRNAGDVMDHLGLPVFRPAEDQLPEQQSGPEPLPFPASPTPVAGDSDESLQGFIMSEVAAGPVHLDTLALGSGVSVVQVTVVVQALVAAGRVTVDGATVSLRS